MVNLAGNIVCRTSWALNSRALLIPWMKKNSVVWCSKGRVYCSSFPVKYIPKKSGKSIESNTTSMPMKGPENSEMPSISQPEVFKIEVSNRGKSSRRSFVMDQKSQNQTQNEKTSSLSFQESEEEIHDDSAVVDSGFMSNPEEVVGEFCTNQGTDPRIQGGLRGDKAKQDAEKLAIELLATRAYTKAELRKKLIGKRFTLDIVEAVIMEYQSRGLINDCLFAEAFSRSRWSSSSWGPRRIKQALFMKGVSEVDAEKAIKLVFVDGDSGDQESIDSRLGISKLSMDHLYVQASKQWLRSRDASTETRKTRLIRWLQYRGFNWGVISFIVKKLESEHSP